jgi:hypothetical protein
MAGIDDRDLELESTVQQRFKRRVVALKRYDSGQVDFNDYVKVRQGSAK